MTFKIKTRLLLANALGLLFFLLIFFLSISFLNKTTGSLISNIYDKTYKGSVLVLNADRDMYQALNAKKTAAYQKIQNLDYADSLKDYQENVEQAKTRISNTIKILSDREKYINLRHKESKQNIYDSYDLFNKKFNLWVEKSNSFLNKLDTEQNLELAFIDEITVTDVLFEDARESINVFGEILEKIADNTIIENKIQNKNYRLFFMIFIFFIAILFFLISRSNSSRISTAIKDFKDIFLQNSSGDLSENIEISIKDEFGEIGLEYNKTISIFTDVIQEIQNGAENILFSTKEINTSNDELARKSSEQASGLEEISASLEEISAIINSNSDKTLAAKDISENTKSETEKVGILSESLKKSITEINESSKKIQNIIEVINEISFQTNLLSLNAAVEAARAGEAGRGFAVVALEVRNLAARSSKAAKEIKELINESVSRVEQGTNTVDLTIISLKDIILNVNKVNQVIVDISSSSQEEKIGIDEINKAVFSLDEATQTTAGISEETSSSTNLLFEESLKFINKIKYFKLKKDDSNNKTIKEFK